MGIIPQNPVPVNPDIPFRGVACAPGYAALQTAVLCMTEPDGSFERIKSGAAQNLSDPSGFCHASVKVRVPA